MNEDLKQASSQGLNSHKSIQASNQTIKPMFFPNIKIDIT